nr:response regulator [uncultured Methanospirillum sp.]
MNNQADVPAIAHERVLHVDDEPMICDVTRLCLERGGRFRVDVVYNAEEALALLRSGSYSCVISDYEMPTMNGIELLKEIRSFDPEIPFILFSGRGKETVVIEAINTGADFFIQKGGDTKTLFAELNHKVDYAITKHNARLALKRRDAILEAVSLVATLFLGGEAFKKALKESLTLFGLATEVDMVLVFREDPHNPFDQRYHRLCGWSRLGDPEPAEGLILCPGSDSCWEEKILQGSPVVGSAGNFSDVADRFINEENIRSIAAFPIIADRKVRGMIWFCDCLTERKWEVVEVDALQAAASIVGSALHQEEMHSELLSGKEKYESMYSMMRQLCDTVPDMLWARDLHGRYMFKNKEASQKLPCSTGILTQPDATSQQESKARDESVLVDGKQVDLEIRKVPFYDQAGELIGSVGIGHDVTAEREATKALIIERRRYAGIFHHIHIGLLTCDPGGEIHESNDRASELLGKMSGSLRGMNLHSIPGLGEIGLLTDFSKAQALRQPIHGRCEYSTKASPKKTLYYSIQPYYDEELRITEVLLTIDEHYQD